MGLLSAVLLAVPGFLLAIVVHETAHAWAADRLGDPTARMLGRLSFNPLRHLDPWGTVALPLMLLFASGGSMVFGYARPVPVSPANFKSPRRDEVLVSLAGPAANVLTAVGLVWLAWLGHALGFMADPGIRRVLQAAVNINLILAAFNMLPVPPLDGSEILTALLPGPWAYRFRRLAPYGMLIIMGLYFTGLLRVMMIPTDLLLQLLLAPFGNPLQTPRGL